MTGKTNTLAKKQTTRARYGFTPFRMAYGIPTFASPNGEMLHIAAIITSNIMITFLCELILESFSLTFSTKQEIIYRFRIILR